METIDLVKYVLEEHRVSYFTLEKYEHLPYHIVSVVGGYLMVYKDTPMVEVWASSHVLQMAEDLMVSQIHLTNTDFHADYLMNRIKLLAEEHAN